MRLCEADIFNKLTQSLQIVDGTTQSSAVYLAISLIHNNIGVGTGGAPGAPAPPKNLQLFFSDY